MAGAASSLAGEPADDTITIERADFRELVIALRTLREQRKADQLALRSAREALGELGVLALREAPASTALRELVAALPQRVPGFAGAGDSAVAAP